MVNVFEKNPDDRKKNSRSASNEYNLPGWASISVRCVIIVAAVFWIYWPGLRGYWVWDDVMYIADNPLLKDPMRVWKAWFQPGSFVEYYPLEQTVQWFQWKCFGDDTLGYHLTNVVLHCTNALLVWRLFHKLGLRLAWLGGLIFAIHPVTVESVAWISELKNTLSLPPLLCAMCAWVALENRGALHDYFVALAFFIIAMLCKISAAPFFAVILLYAWWRRGRLGLHDVIRSIPFFVIGAGLSLISAYASSLYMKTQTQPADVPQIGGFIDHVFLSTQTLSVYFFKCFWPVDLMPIYPQWKIDAYAVWAFLPGFAWIGVIYFLWRNRATWGRHALLGLGFFILFLGPFLGLISISYLSFSWVMDHLLYLPIIGLIGVVVAGAEEVKLLKTSSVRPFILGILTIILGLFAIGSHRYVTVFTDDEAFWTYIVLHNPQLAGAHANLGEIFLKTNQPEQALAQFEESIRLKPQMAGPYVSLATAFLQLGRIPEATDALRKSLEEDPGNPEANNNMALLLDHMGNSEEAIAHLKRALESRPNYLDAHKNLGHLFQETGHPAEAIEQFQLALKISPADATALENLEQLQPEGEPPANTPGR
jgi:tetratricopeptide (TPR) repeat protein